MANFTHHVKNIGCYIPSSIWHVVGTKGFWASHNISGKKLNGPMAEARGTK
jgi:hypothetical protein